MGALNATRRFAEWCDAHGLRDLVDVEPIHVPLSPRIYTQGRPRGSAVVAVASQSLRQTGLAKSIGKGVEVLGALEREPFTKFG